MKRRKWRPWGWFDLKFFLIQPSGPESVRKYSVGFKFLILSNSFYKWSLFSLLDTVSKENWSILFWKHHYFYFMALFATKLYFKCKQLESAEKYSCWWLMSSSEMRAQLQMANNTSGRQRWWCTLKSPKELTQGHSGQEPGFTWAPLTSVEGHHMGRGAEGLAVGACNLLLAWGDQPNRGQMKTFCDEQWVWNGRGSSRSLLLPLAPCCPFSPPAEARSLCVGRLYSRKDIYFFG